MNFKPIVHFVGAIWIALGGAMLLSLIPGLIYGDGGLVAILTVGLSTIVLGAVCFMLTRGGRDIRLREALFSVSFTWVSASVIGAMPFLIAGLLGFSDALFESVSGFTTTGASVVDNVEVWPHALLFWRSMTHCLGGMGIVVMSLAVLPLLGYGGVELFQTEAVGPIKDKLTPRVRETAQILWGIYLGLIVIGVMLLWAGGMNLFDSICHSFAAIATGGFSTKNTSIGFYNSHYINLVITFLMLAGGTNFALHYYAFRGKPLTYFRDIEFRWWIGAIMTAVVIITLFNTIQGSEPVGSALEGAAFSVSSIISTTGYVTVDFDKWAFAPKFILLLFLFSGSCAGSTCGSIKMFRWVVAVKAIRLQMRKNLHPQAIMPLQVGGKKLPDETVKAILIFILSYIGMVIIGALILMAYGIDMVSALSGVATCAAGCGPGLGTLGPTETYSAVPVAVKYVLMAEMLLGRLEIFSMLVIFTRGFWRP